MKTTEEIIKLNSTIMLDSTQQGKINIIIKDEDKKWYSEEEIIEAIDKVLDIDFYNNKIKKELFGDKK